MKTLARASGFCFLAVLACAALTACPPPVGQTVTLSGKVIDGSSGAALVGARVYFSTHEATTAGDGTFSMTPDLGETGMFVVDQAGYVHTLIAGVSCGADTSVLVKAIPIASGPSHSFGGKIYEYQTNPASPTEISSGSTYGLYIINAAGASSSEPTNFSFNSYNPVATPSYSGTTRAYGTDCLVVAIVNPAGMNPFNVVRRQVDLSASTTAIDLSQDTAHTSTVTVTADQVGNSGSLLLYSSYGILPVGDTDFSASATVSLDVTNPYGYEYIASQKKEVPNSPSAGYVHSFQSTSTPAPLGTSVALPTIDATLGPTAAADPTTLAYASGTLSVAPVAGASLYVFQLVDNGSGNPLGMFSSSDPSITLPGWLATELHSLSIRVTVMAADSNATWDVGTALLVAGKGPYTPGLKIAITASMSGANYKDLAF